MSQNRDLLARIATGKAHQPLLQSSTYPVECLGGVVTGGCVAQVKHEDGVSYAELADETEGFSGADLRAIVSEAQLSAVMAHLERLKAAEAAGGAPDKPAEHTTPLVSAAVRPWHSSKGGVCLYHKPLLRHVSMHTVLSLELRSPGAWHMSSMRRYPGL